MRCDHHRIAFFLAYGDGPWDCIYCGEEVGKEHVHVHHRNEDHEDDNPSNLAPTHAGCHMKLHKKGKAGNRNRHKVRRDSRTGVRDVKPYKTGFLVRYTCLKCRARHYVGRNRLWTLEDAEQVWKEFDLVHQGSQPMEEE